jgi:hypothetical protein
MTVALARVPAPLTAVVMRVDRATKAGSANTRVRSFWPNEPITGDLAERAQPRRFGQTNPTPETWPNEPITGDLAEQPNDGDLAKQAQRLRLGQTNPTTEIWPNEPNDGDLAKRTQRRRFGRTNPTTEIWPNEPTGDTGRTNPRTRSGPPDHHRFEVNGLTSH